MTPETPREAGRRETALPLTARDVEYWRTQVADRDVDPDITWPDAEVLHVVARFLATLAAAPATGLPAAPDLLRLHEDLTMAEERFVATGGTGMTEEARAAYQDLLAARRTLRAAATGLAAAEGLREAMRDVVKYIRTRVAAEPTLAWPGEIDDILDDAEVVIGLTTPAALAAADRAERGLPLDVAWAEAVAALPEGWWVEKVYLRERGTRLETFSAWARRPDSDGGMRGDGSTPSAALIALAVVLREVR